MATEALKKVGVEAVVEGLSEFKSNVGELNKSMDSIGQQGNVVTRTLSALGGAFGYLGDKIVDVATYALGQLLARAIEFVLSKLAELVSGTIEAGSQFQILSLRLDRLNLNSVTDAAGHLTRGLDYVTAATKEQLAWVTKLAVTTPYDAQDIANVFTLARSYGFAADSAKGLTEDITSFAAGMGLGNTEIQRIIVNFGQMVQQGKVTQREMNDLARGAFVPVNDIIKQMQKDVGLTGKAFDKFKASGDGVNAFMTAFSEVVKSRFTGASQAMARTFQGATANAQDFVKSLLGLNVIKPILDQVGGGLADFIAALTSPEKWNLLTIATQRLGGEIVKLIEAFAGAGKLNTEDIFQGILSAVLGFSDWIQSHREEIVAFFTNIAKGVGTVVNFIRTQLVPGIQAFIGNIVEHKQDIQDFFGNVAVQVGKVADWVQNYLVPAFYAFSDWAAIYGPTIDSFFGALGNILSTVLSNLTGGRIDTTGIQGLLDIVTAFMQYVIDNQDKIAGWVETLVRLWAILQVVGAVLSFIVGVFLTLGSAILSVVLLVGSVIAVITALATPVGALIIVLLALAAAWMLMGDNAKIGFQFIINVIQTGAANIVKIIQALAVKIVDIFQVENWGQIGEFMVKGITEGVKRMGDLLIDAMKNLAKAAVDAVQNALGIQSPSKVFAQIGVMSMKGMAAGILKSMGIVTGAMETAVSQVMAPALTAPVLAQQYTAAPSMVNNSNSYTNNWVLNVQSNTSAESIVQDYGMLKSLAGTE